MKILFLAPRLPLPADSGAKIRTLNLLKNLALDNEVTLLSFDFRQKENRECAEEIKALGIDIHIIKKTDGLNPVFFISPAPFAIKKYYSLKMVLKLQRLVSKKKFDLAHFDHIHMGQYRDYIPALPSILDEHNVESLILKRCAGMKNNLMEKALFSSQAEKMARFESELTTRFTKCLTVSDYDKQQLYDLTDGKADIEVIPNGVDTVFFGPKAGNCAQKEEDSLVFTGSMDWLPNNDAVIYFCKEILPLVWAKNKRIKFYVVGKNPSRELMRLTLREERIIVTGIVKDVRPYIEKSKVYIVPIRVGGGTRLKILEAMSMKKTIISTCIGAEGINYTDNKNIIIRNNPSEFAGAIIEYLEDGEKRRSIGKAAGDLVRENYDWKIIAGKLKNIYGNIIHG